MGFQLLVRDQYGKPVKNAKITIKWKSGISTVYTDGSGSVYISTDGFVVYTDLYGDKVYHEVYTNHIDGALKHIKR